VTDSSCDLPAHLVEAFEIGVVPLLVHFGTEAYHDGELSAEEFWEKAAGPHLPKTSQPAVGAFEAVFEQSVARGERVLCVTVTARHSGTFNAARLAAERFGKGVTVFDSWSLSLGLGIQALAAAQTARAGRPMGEILALLEDLRVRMRLTILLDTLENIRRGGRADAFIAVAGRMTRALNIKVIVNFVEGQLRLLGAARSSERGLGRMLNVVEGMGPLERLAVVHTRNPELAQRMASRLAEHTHFPREHIWVRETGAALATHAGPGVIGVLALPTPATD
jgi:DegV family protein with EDD domain